MDLAGIPPRPAPWDKTPARQIHHDEFHRKPLRPAPRNGIRLALVLIMLAAGFPLAQASPAPVSQETPVAAPCTPSPIIQEIHWAPRETIIRQAPGSDNWPLTWADDDALYGAFGDGRGFMPFVPKKLSLGFARITGDPSSIQGANIAAPTGEGFGADKAGRKASGLLMVDGVLYLLARNVGNAQLAWSTNHARTWTWSDWKFDRGFGCPTFLNFGKNYAGARDGFVYVYSPDTDSAYTPADRFVLARVPKDRIRQRAAWEFFRQMDENGKPVWSKKIHDCGAVFKNPGRCYRSGITYDAGLKRYLWCQILPASRHPEGPRFQGGFGIYDAPEPWGPWTRAFYTEDWDVGPGESSSFPTKWMSPDGKSLFLVFSGDDFFSVRKAELILKNLSPQHGEIH